MITKVKKDNKKRTSTFDRLMKDPERKKEFDESYVCSCPKKCTDPKKLSAKIRKQIFNMFWNIGSYEGRCAFLNSCVNEAPKKKQYTKAETSRRKNTRRLVLKPF